MTKTDVEIGILKTKQENMMSKITGIEKLIGENHSEIKQLIESMKQDFVLKSSFKAAMGVVAGLATVFGLITYFTK